MRAACGLPAEDVALRPIGAGHGVPLGPARAWWRPWRRGRHLVGCMATKRGLFGAVCLSWSTAWRDAGTSALSTTSAGCTRTCGRVWRPGTVCGPAATEGERVVEGATTERQVRGAVDPAHSHGTRGVRSLPACGRQTHRTPRNAASRPLYLLVRMRRPHQAPCQIAGGMRREGEPEGSRCVERDGRGREAKWAAKAQKYRSHLTWMTAVRDQVAVVETDNMADLALSQGGTTIANLVRHQFHFGNLGRRHSSPLGVQRCSNLVRARALPPAISWCRRFARWTSRSISTASWCTGMCRK